MSEHDIEKKNRIFYDQLYGGQSPLIHLVRSIISFDQQAKSKPNWHILRTFFVEDFSTLEILDYGCGWGTLLLKFPRTSQAYCFDLSHNAMQMVRKTHALLGRHVLFAQIDIENNITPIPYDVISCSHVLEHVPDDVYLLKKFFQALTPQGLLLINVPINETWYDPKHIRKYTQTSLKESLQDVGFKVVESEQVDKWTGFFLDRELNPNGINPIKRIFLRGLRLLLALLPYSLLRLSENLLLKHRPYQQAIVIGRKIE